MIGTYASKIAVALALSGALAAAGCGRESPCREVAERMVELANAPLEGDEATKPEARERLASTCTAESWPAELRACLLAASDQDEATACMRRLADE